MLQLANFFNFRKKKKLRALRRERWDKFKKQKPKTLRQRLNNPYFPKKPLSQEELEKKSKQWLKGESWVYLSIIVIFIILISYLIFGTGFLTLNRVDIQGNENITDEELKELVNNILNSKTLFFIPLNNFVTFPASAAEAIISDEVNNQFALEDLEVKKKFPNTVKINIKERTPGLTWVTQGQYYYIDPEGIISTALTSAEEVNAEFPKIYDQNNKVVKLDQQVISQELVDFILHIEDTLPKKTHLKIDSYSIPQIQCQEKEYIMEKVFKEEITETEDEEIKAKKEKIQERFKAGDITVEESLELLEKINTNKQKKNKKNKKNKNSEDKKDDETQESIVWETVYKPVECDFVKINSEINVKINQDKMNFEIYLDSKLDLNKQLDNLNSLLNEKIDDPSKINYIDLRFPDRIYYK